MKNVRHIQSLQQSIFDNFSKAYKIMGATPSLISTAAQSPVDAAIFPASPTYNPRIPLGTEFVPRFLFISLKWVVSILYQDKTE